jgi:hypothetical protein
MTKRMLILATTALTLALYAAVPAAGAAAPQVEEGRREVFTGTLMGIGGTAGGRTAPFTLTLDSYVTRQQALQYVNLLREKGQDAFQRQIDDRDLGSFSLTGRIRRQVNFAFSQPTEEGRRIIILFERWVQPYELRYGTRSQNYPFSYLELSIDREGKGHGTFIGAARVYFEKDDPSTLTVENFGVYPLRVVGVEQER